jgi:hypothetical protein
MTYTADSFLPNELRPHLSFKLLPKSDKVFKVKIASPNLETTVIETFCSKVLELSNTCQVFLT